MTPFVFMFDFSGKGAAAGVSVTGVLGGDVWKAIPDAASIKVRMGLIHATFGPKLSKRSNEFPDARPPSALTTPVAHDTWECCRLLWRGPFPPRALAQ
jgi:hypothetical protein